MNLIQNLRTDINNKWTLLVKKNKCEICSTELNLEVHHEIQFIELLRNSLELLELEYKEDTNDYTVKELEKIKLILLGKHLNIKGITLCQSCHDDEHIIHNLFKRIKQMDKEKYYDDDILLINNKLNQIKDKKLFDLDKEDLVKFLSESIYNCIKIRNGYHTVKIKTINKFFIRNNVQYELKSIKESIRRDEDYYRKRYWIICEI